MPRSPRPQHPDATYHVTARGIDGLYVFGDDDDRRSFLATLKGVVQDLRWACLAYCLLGTHYHLLVRTPNPDIAVGMHRLNSEHARRFNLRYARTGHVFERRYHTVLVTSDRHLLATARYIALNPVAAGIVSDPAAWPWSSHPAIVSPTATTAVARAELLSHFGSWGGDPLARYREFVAAGDPTDPAPVAPRPSARDLVDELGLNAGLLAARQDHRLTMRQIAEDLGWHESKVWRHLHRT